MRRPLVLTKQLFLLSFVKTSWRFFQIFVAFSEDLNFRSLQILDIISSWCDERKLWIQIYFTYILENVEDWTCQHLTWWKHHTFEFKAETIFNFRIASHYSKKLLAVLLKWAFVIWTVIKMQIFNVDYKSSVIVRRPQNLKKISYSFLKLLCNVKTKWEIFWHSQNIWTLWMFDSKGEKCSWKSLERVQPAQVFLAWTYVVVIFQEFT